SRRPPRKKKRPRKNERRSWNRLQRRKTPRKRSSSRRVRLISKKNWGSSHGRTLKEKKPGSGRPVVASLWRRVHLRAFLHRRLNFDIRSLNFRQHSCPLSFRQPLIVLIGETLFNMSIFRGCRLHKRFFAGCIGLTGIVGERLTFHRIDRFPHRITRVLRQHAGVGECHRHGQQHNSKRDEQDERGFHDTTSLYWWSTE